MVAPPIFPQVMAMVRMNRKALWEKLFFVHVAFGLTTYTVYKIPVTDADRQASKTLNPWQPAAGH